MCPSRLLYPTLIILVSCCSCIRSIRRLPQDSILHTGNHTFEFTCGNLTMDEQAQHICYIVKECAAGNINTVEATAAAENAWVEEIIGMSRFSQEFLESCTPGYYNNEGQPNPKSIQNGSYGAGPDAFFAKIKQWRDEGTMEGLDLG